MIVKCDSNVKGCFFCFFLLIQIFVTIIRKGISEKRLADKLIAENALDKCFLMMKIMNYRSDQFA